MGQSWWSYDRRFYKETEERRYSNRLVCIAHSLSPLRLITELIIDTNAMYFDAALAEESVGTKKEWEGERQSVCAIITINDYIIYSACLSRSSISFNERTSQSLLTTLFLLPLILTIINTHNFLVIVSLALVEPALSLSAGFTTNALNQ